MRTLREALERAIDWIFPRDASRTMLEGMSPAEFSEFAAKPMESPPYGVHALFRYRNPLVHDALWLLKFKGSGRMAKLLGTLLADAITDTLADERLFSNVSKPVLVPVPSSAKRSRERGWNQTEMLAREVAKRASLECRPDALRKVRHTKRQVHLHRNDRLSNLDGAFEASGPIVRGRNIVLVDDIVTTGSTMKECSRALTAGGARCVLCFAVAH